MRGEETVLAGQQLGRQRVEHEVDGKGTLALRARWKSRKFRAAPEKGLPPLKSFSKCETSIAALRTAVSVPDGSASNDVDSAVSNREVGKPFSPQNENPGHGLRRVHPPPTPVEAQAGRRFHQAQRIVRITQPEALGIGEAFRQSVANEVRCLGKDSQIAVVPGVVEKLELDAVGLDDLASEPRCKQSKVRNRRTGAEPIAYRGVGRT